MLHNGHDYDDKDVNLEMPEQEYSDGLEYKSDEENDIMEVKYDNEYVNSEMNETKSSYY